MGSRARWLRERSIFANQTTSAEGGQLLAQGNHLLFEEQRRFAGLMLRGAGTFDQSPRALLLIAAEPLAHGGNGGLEQTRRGFDPPLPCTLDQTQAMIVTVAHFTHQDERSGRHGGGWVRRGAGDKSGWWESGNPAKSKSTGFPVVAQFELSHYRISTFPPPDGGCGFSHRSHKPTSSSRCRFVLIHFSAARGIRCE